MNYYAPQNPEDVEFTLRNARRKKAVTGLFLAASVLLGGCTSTYDARELDPNAPASAHSKLSIKTTQKLRKMADSEAFVSCEPKSKFRARKAVVAYVDVIKPESSSDEPKLSNIIHARRYICKDFTRPELPPSDGTRGRQEFRNSLAYYAFAHEQQHVEGVTDEGEASCKALQKLPDYVEELSLRDDTQQRIVADTYNYVALFQTGKYSIEGCELPYLQ